MNRRVVGENASCCKYKVSEEAERDLSQPGSALPSPLYTYLPLHNQVYPGRHCNLVPRVRVVTRPLRASSTNDPARIVGQDEIPILRPRRGSFRSYSLGSAIPRRNLTGLICLSQPLSSRGVLSWKFDCAVWEQFKYYRTWRRVETGWMRSPFGRLSRYLDIYFVDPVTT